MIAWRTTYVWYFLPLLMIGFIAYAGWASQRLPGGAELGQVPLASPTASPRVEAAVSIEAPLVNPVLHIDVPEKSLFAPQ
ncbi:MAG: hypothetical protein HYZ63_04035 [Candidatus Andersenbacteria bacterium]|nr:hypothetical protein [Candidatus Andersenbacteria bacterium]